MARIVERTQIGPYKLELGGETKYLCRCGLSKNQPFCDASHKLVANEEAGKTYWYDDAGNRYETSAAYPGIRSF